MNDNTAIKDNKKIRTIIIKLVFLITNLIIILILFLLLSIYSSNPIIIILIVVFAFLVIIGPFFRRNRKSYYSRIFPNKSTKHLEEYKGLKKKRSSEGIAPTQLSHEINFDFKYKKPVLRKCPKCGMILPSFVKKCPVCNKSINE
ncbi:MAG: hypothetical protein EU539_09725 [Promethearchaeota archaeon]|nr:MAG: hypothetical protein EU539_09725 [Candidatus Lokiarchaeota archaeon]